MAISIAETRLLQDLKRRVEALERRLMAHGGNLAAHNAVKKARASELHERIRAVMESSAQPNRLTSKHVLKALGYPDIAPRTIRLHMRAIRQYSGVAAIPQELHAH